MLKNNIKVGDYVRNKYGIAKVVDIETKNDINILRFDRDIAFVIDKEENKELYRSNYLPLTEYIDIDKINFSSDIIDLIQIGDYVNGRKVTKIHLDRTIDERKRILCGDTTFDCLEEMYVNEDIVSIVTHEQFEAMEYEIEK